MTSGVVREATSAPSNLALMAGAITVASACLWIASHATSPLVVLMAAILFGFAGNTIFSFMHEAVHGNFHPNHIVNEAARQRRRCVLSDDLRSAAPVASDAPQEQPQ